MNYLDIDIKNKNISIVGLGYVGLTLAVALARSGFNVYGIDVNEDVLTNLQNKKAHFFEPGLDGYLEELIKKKLFVSKSLPSDIEYMAHIISVGTPLKSDGLPNFSHLTTAINAIKDAYSGKELVILRSTVSVGVTRKIVCPLLATYTNVPQEELRVAFCPERTIEGKAIDELTSLPQIISGLNSESVSLAEAIFKNLTPSIVRVQSLEAGELVKLFNNTYRDIHFSIGNCFNLIAQNFGVDGLSVIKAANFGYDRSKIPLPGFVGGPCLEKDAYILVNSYKDTHHTDEVDFVLGARKYNESIVGLVIEWFEQHRSKLLGQPIVVSGLAFKGVPETSDLRGSTAIPIIKKLSLMGFPLRLHDFCATESELESLGCGPVYKNLEDACSGAKGLLILNNHHCYKKIDYAPMVTKMTTNPFIFDTWQTADHAPLKNITYLHLGNFQLVQL